MKHKWITGIGMAGFLALILLIVPGIVLAQGGEFKVVSTAPADGAKDVPETSSIVIRFSDAVNESTLVKENFIIMNTLDDDFFDSEISYDNTTYTLTLANFEHHGRSGIHRGAHIEVKLLNIKDIYGNALVGSDGIPGSNYVFNFDVEKRAEEEDSPGFGLLMAVLVVGVVLSCGILKRLKK